MRLIGGKQDRGTAKTHFDGREMAGIKVLLRGGGEMASGVAHCLALAGLRVLISELPTPLAVRREVSFCEAVFDERKTVEGVTAQRIGDVSQAPALWQRGELPVLVDPSMECLRRLEPQVIVDALLAKRNTGLHRDMAPLTIGLGPGFRAPEDVHVALETKRGHDLGRLIYQGSPVPNTGIPGNTEGYTYQRVLRAPADGVFETNHKLGDAVEAGQSVATVDGQDVVAGVGGVLRGPDTAGLCGAPRTKGRRCGPQGRDGLFVQHRGKAAQSGRRGAAGHHGKF